MCWHFLIEYLTILIYAWEIQVQRTDKRNIPKMLYNQTHNSIINVLKIDKKIYILKKNPRAFQSKAL